MAARKQARTTEQTRTLLVEETGSRSFKITIPADWKVTFGAFQQNKFGGEGSALRVYEAENKQRACFVNVKSFRDLSLPITRLVVHENGSETWESDTDGNLVKTTKRNRRVSEVVG